MRRGDEMDAAGTENPRHGREHLDGLGQVLDRHGVQHRVESPLGERQVRALVQVVDEKGREPRVLSEFDPVHAETDDAPVVDLGGEVRYPGRHEIQDARPRGYQLAIDLRQCGDGRIVDVRDETRLAIEVLVGRLVEASEQIARERRHGGRHIGKAAHRGRGGRPVVVLAHGFGGSARNFAPQARALRD